MEKATKRSMTQLEKDRGRKQSTAYQQNRRSLRYSTLESSMQHHYGDTAQQPDISPEELRVLCEEYYHREVVVSTEEATQIEVATREQADSALWFQHRRKRLTASNFGKVAKRRPTTPVANMVKALLYSRSLETKALRWGRTHEADARQAYQSFMTRSYPGAVVSLSGLIVDTSEPCLACSPDGLVHLPGSPKPDGVVELKCPYTAAQNDMAPSEAALSLKVFFCKPADDGRTLLRRGHDYFYQVQGLLAITNCCWCDFVTWTPKGMSVERIHFDRSFWEGVKTKLLRFYREAILPELTLPRHISGQEIREPTVDTSS